MAQVLCEEFWNGPPINWIGHILRRNCLLHRIIAGMIKGGIEVTGRRGRWRRKLLDDLKERRGYSQLKEEARDRTMWRARFGRGFGPVVRQTTKWINEPLNVLVRTPGGTLPQVGNHCCIWTSLCVTRWPSHTSRCWMLHRALWYTAMQTRFRNVGVIT